MRPTVWQRLGAFVYTGENLLDAQLEAFAAAGGAWIVVVLLGDEAAGPWNRAHIGELKARCARFGLGCGAWFNGAGAPAADDAIRFAELANREQLAPVVLDLEADYQYPGGDPALMPELVWRLRGMLPKSALAVSTNGGPNNAMIWNGRTLSPRRSFFRLGVRCLPQWYSGYYNHDAATKPAARMLWLQENGATDDNFADPRSGWHGYGLPVSFVHPTLEVTGLEGSNLAQEIADLRLAKLAGFSVGFSVYTLENASPADVELLRQASALHL